MGKIRVISHISKIILLISAILFTSCEEETQVVRIQNNSIKNVNNLSYLFINNKGKKDSAVKSGNEVKSCLTSDNIQSVSKVLAIETFEIDGELFTASLIEESELIETKVSLPNPQLINGSGVYTFYAYNNSAIKEQEITADKKKFEVPKDAATNYGMIFLSVVDGAGIPEPGRLLFSNPIANDKWITYTTVFNENVCYKTFDKGNMPTDDDIDITFTPVFSQIGISVPNNLSGKTIKVDEFRLEQGVQETAVVKIDYNGQETSNISVTYQQEPTTDYKQVLTCVPNTANDATILEGDYYNIIPNGNPAEVYIKMSAVGTTTTEYRTIKFKDADLKPIPFECKKRYLIKIQNKTIEITPSETTLKYGLTQQLKLEIIYSDGRREEINNTEIIWSATNDATVSTDGLVTVTKEGTATITATYKGIGYKATITPEIYMRFMETDYYMWDAYNPYDKNNADGIYPYWGPYNSSYHSGAGVAPVTSRFTSACSYDDARKYLGNGVNWSETDGLIYTLMGVSTLYCDGLWLKKGSPNDQTVTPTSIAYPSIGLPTNPEDYFFLPNCGYFGKDGDTNTQGARYWLSTSNAYSSDKAYCIRILKSGASVISNNRKLGCYPFTGFDSTN